MIQSHSINQVFILLFFGVFFATSCEEPVDLDIATQEPQIVVNSTFLPGQPFQVSVSKSKNILAPEADEYINDAIVRIFSNGEALEELQLKHFRHPLYQSRITTPESGKVYRLEVSVPGKELVVAEDIVPFPVTLDDISLDTIEIIGEADERVYKVEITVNFEDPIGAQDYYHLSLFNQLGTEDRENESMNGFDGEEEVGTTLMPLSPLESDNANPAVTFHYEEGGVLFNDETFDGQKTTLKFYSLLNLQEAGKYGEVVGFLRTVSRPYYLYHSTLSLQIANKDRPFVEPISVYSNIENGLGIFSGYAIFRDSVSISSSF